MVSGNCKFRQPSWANFGRKLDTVRGVNDIRHDITGVTCNHVMSMYCYRGYHTVNRRILLSFVGRQQVAPICLHSFLSSSSRHAADCCRLHSLLYLDDCLPDHSQSTGPPMLCDDTRQSSLPSEASRICQGARQMRRASSRGSQEAKLKLKCFGPFSYKTGAKS